MNPLNLTLDTIRAAQDNDIAATAEVIKAFEGRISALANKESRNADQRDEFAQVARIALWEGLPKWSGDSVDNFGAFMHYEMFRAVKEAGYTERAMGAGGVDRDGLKVFAACLNEARGDLDVAEHLCTTLPPKGRRLSAERAHAVRMAWEGSVSLDVPTEDGEGSIAHVIESDYGVPEDLIEAGDIARGQRDRKIAMVRAVLDSMGAKGSHILKATYGIDPVPCLGTGAEADAELAEELNTKPATVRVLRNQAHKSFETRYSKVTGLTK